MLYTKSALEAHADKAAIETAWDPLKPGFYFLTRAAVLDLTATQLQRMQEMRDSKLLVKVLIDLNDAFQGKGLIESVLFVSHRWEDPATPDETGAQLAAIKAHLLAHPEIQFVWFDYSCMPQRSSGCPQDQDDRTPAEKAEFDLMLKSIADLYLTAKVLILLDTMYRTRFWTTMEGWCAMQKVTPQGVRPARAGESRVTVVCIHNATQHDERALLEMSTKTAEEITKFLGSPDVAVTNKKDKTTMLPIVGKTDERVRKMMSGMHSVIPESHEEELREDENPMRLLLDSARDKVGSLFGVGFKLNERVECRDRGQSWKVGTVVSVEPLKVQPDGAGWTAGYVWDEVRVLSAEAPRPPKAAPAPQPPPLQPPVAPLVMERESLSGKPPASKPPPQPEAARSSKAPAPPPGLKFEGGSLAGDRAKYLGKFLLVDGKLVNGRPAWQHTVDASLWIAFDGACWMGQLESRLGQGRGDLQLSDAAAASPDASSATWQAWTGTAWAAQPQLKCIPWTPPPPRGLKLEGGSLPGDAAEYMGEYRLDGSKLVNGRPVWRHTAHLTCWLAFDGANWRGQPDSDLGQRWGLLLLPDAAAASPNASAATWLAAKVPGAAGVAQPQLKCIPWTPPPPPGLKLKGGSLPGAAAEYVGFYMLDGNKLVNGRPAWKHTDGSRWVAFDGANWRGQPEADLGQKRGALMLTDADTASPDASSATWQAWTGTAWAAQPALTCTVATAAELSAVQAAAALRAKEERRARAAAAREASVQAVRSAAGSCLSSTGSGLASISGCCVSSAGSCLSSTGSGLASISGCCVSSAGFCLSSTGSGLASISGCCVSSAGSCVASAGSCISCRPGIGDRVWLAKSGPHFGRRGRITTDDWSSNPYRVTFDDGTESEWLYPHEVCAASILGCVSCISCISGSCLSSTGSGLASISGCCVSSAGSCLSSTGSGLASISGCCVSSAGSCVASAGSCLASISGCVAPEQVRRFRGPCAACCKPLAPCCCVSADGEAIFCGVPTEPSYTLPACLHMALCPQQGCDPRGVVANYQQTNCLLDYFALPLLWTLCFTPLFFCFQEEGGRSKSGPQ
jgi:hypothetical protein